MTDTVEKLNMVPSFPLIEDIYSIGPKRKWFVVYTNPKCEEKAAKGMQAKGFRSYLPMFSTWAKQSRLAKHQNQPKVRICRPLLARYVFVELPADQTPFGVVRLVDGVREILGDSAAPLPVPGRLIERLREREDDGAFDETVKKGRTFIPRWLSTGADVRVSKGAFSGLIAMVESILPKDEVVLNVPMFGRTTKVTLPIDNVVQA